MRSRGGVFAISSKKCDASALAAAIKFHASKLDVAQGVYCIAIVKRIEHGLDRRFALYKCTYLFI